MKIVKLFRTFSQGSKAFLMKMIPSIIVFNCHQVMEFIYMQYRGQKGLRYRSNHKQCRESRGVVGSINVSSVLSSEQFRREGLRDPGHGCLRNTCVVGRKKTKGCQRQCQLRSRTELVEKSERVFFFYLFEYFQSILVENFQ